MSENSAPPPELIIAINKKTDASVTGQRQDGQQGRFFPLHDLTHYTVETLGRGADRGEAHSLELTDADLARIRAGRRALVARWQELPPGETLELPFPICGR